MVGIIIINNDDGDDNGFLVCFLALLRKVHIAQSSLASLELAV